MEPDRRITFQGRREADIAMVTRLIALETRLDTLVDQLAGLPEHVDAMCRIAHAIRIVLAPAVWVAGNLRQALLWLGATAAAGYAIWLAFKEWHGWGALVSLVQ